MKDIRLFSTYFDRCKKDNEGYCVTFNGGKEYRKTDNLPKEPYNYVIHMYPIEDTTSEQGNLNGYDDSLFFKAVIYNEDLYEYFIVPILLDAVHTVLDGVEFQIRMFKDQSTMIILHGKHRLKYYRTLEISK